MFLHVSVILFTGVCLFPECITGHMIRQGSTSRWVCLQGVSINADPYPRDTVNRRAVHILLECMLVKSCHSNFVNFKQINSQYVKDHKQRNETNNFHLLAQLDTLLKKEMDDISPFCGAADTPVWASGDVSSGFQSSYPEIVPLSALIACNAMNWPGGAAIYCLPKLHHWLMLYTLGQYIVNVQWSITGEGFLTIFKFRIRNRSLPHTCKQVLVGLKTGTYHAKDECSTNSSLPAQLHNILKWVRNKHIHGIHQAT